MLDDGCVPPLVLPTDYPVQLDRRPAAPLDSSQVAVLDVVEQHRVGNSGVRVPEQLLDVGMDSARAMPDLRFSEVSGVVAVPTAGLDIDIGLAPDVEHLPLGGVERNVEGRAPTDSTGPLPRAERTRRDSAPLPHASAA
jgi:hypothetical protein